MKIPNVNISSCVNSIVLDTNGKIVDGAPDWAALGITIRGNVWVSRMYWTDDNDVHELTSEKTGEPSDVFNVHIPGGSSLTYQFSTWDGDGELVDSIYVVFNGAKLQRGHNGGR